MPEDPMHPLVREVSAGMWVKQELGTMWMIGWPMLVAFFCRFGMMSMDASFVGHLSSSQERRLRQMDAAVSLQRVSKTFLGGLGIDLEEAVGGGMVEEGKDEDLSYVAMPSGLMFMEGVLPGHVSVGLATAEGHTTKEYLGGASLSDMLTSVATVPLLALGFGLNPLVGQAMGSGNLKMAGTWVQLALFCVTVAAVPVHIVFFFVRQILEALSFEPALCELAGVYAMFSTFWVLPNSWYVIFRFYFQAQGKPRPAMYSALIFFGVNAFLGWTFVFGGPIKHLGWQGLGFVGAACAISVSRDLQSLTYYLYMWVYRKAHLSTWPGWNWDFLQRRHLRAFLAQTLPQVGSLFLQIAIGQSTTLLVARLGALAVASSTAATSCTMPFTLCFMITLSALAGIRVGFYLGKGDANLAKRTAWLIMGCGAGTMLVFGAIVLPFRREILRFFTSDPEVQRLATDLMPPIMLNFLATSLVQCGTGGVLASQGRTSLATWLSIFFELPLSLGSIAVLVLVFRAHVRVVYWVQAAASVVESVVVLFIIARSDWPRFAKEAQERQKSR